MLKLLVVEDHVLVREGLAQTLRHLEEEAQIFEATDGDSSLAMLEKESPFDLMVLDLALPGRDGFSCLAEIQSLYPEMPVVILSAYDDAHTMSKAVRCGAAGFVPKTYSGDQLLAALREELAGQRFFPGQMPAAFPANSPFVPVGSSEPSDFGLTERQAEVLALMSRGKSNRDIGAQLGLSEGTVKVHMTTAFKALGVSSRTQAMVVIARHGIRL